MRLRTLMSAAVMAGLVCGLIACGGLEQPPSFPGALYATTVSGPILIFPVSVSGALGAPAAIPGPPNSQGLAIVPPLASLSTLYVSDPAADAIQLYTISESNNVPSLAALGPYRLGSGNGSPEAMLNGGPSGPLSSGFLYVATSAGMIAGFSVGSNGALTPVPGSPFMAGAGISQLVESFVTTSGPAAPPVCLYASDNADPNGGISAFEIQNNGALAPVAGSPFATVAEGGPTALLATAVGTGSAESGILYVALSSASAIAAFTAASDCSLSPVAGSPFPAGKGVASLVRFYALFAGNSADGTISSYNIDQTTGALTPVATVPFNGVAGSGSAIEFNGTIYLSNSANDSLPGFQVLGSSPANPEIAPLTGSPFNALAQTLALAFLFRPVIDP